jgi:hypothetical protein
METIDTCKAELDNYRNTREQVRNSSSLMSREQAARNRKEHSKSGGNKGKSAWRPHRCGKSGGGRLNFD